MEFFGIFWESYHRFFLIIPVLFAFFLIYKNYKNTKNFVQKIVHERNKILLLKNFSFLKSFLKMCASILAMFFLFIAILQPQWHKKEETIQQEGRNILIMLDISRSMLAQDLKPNRLEFVKLKLKALLQKLDSERVGLILFSGSAFLQCPLTSDFSTFSMFLDQVDVESISSGTTAIDAALQKMIQTFQQNQNYKNKLALLVTDGEDFSLNLKTVQKNAQQENIKIFALGVGTPEGAPIPKLNSSGHETDENGQIALSRLNENLLQNICNSVDGKYVRTTQNDSDIDYIASLVQKFEKESFGDKKLSLYQDQYPWFLGTSWFFMALEWIL